MSAAPEPPGGVGDGPPALRNLLLAVIRLLSDLDGARTLTDDHRVRITALLAVARRFKKGNDL